MVIIYYVEVVVGSICFCKDFVYVVVDSLLVVGLGIMLLDMIVCEGEILVL